MKKENPVSEIFAYAQEGKQRFILSAILSIISVICGLIPYISAAELLSLLIENGSSIDYNQIFNLCIRILAAFIIQEVTGSISTYISHGAAFTTLFNIRTAIIDKLEKMSMGYIKGQSLGEFKKTIIDDVDSLEYALAHAVPEVTSNAVAPIILLIYMFTVSVIGALSAMISTVIGIVIAGTMMAGGAAKIFKVFTEGSAKMNSTVIEYINGMEIIKVFNQTASSMKKYESSVKNYRDVMQAWYDHCYPFLAANNIIAPLSVAFVLPICGFSYIKGYMDIHCMILSVVACLGVAGPIQKLIQFTDHFNEINMVYNKLHLIFNASEITEGKKSINIEDNGISVENIKFAYDDNEIIHGISFEAKAGTMTALVGASGSGKSTLAKLIARFYEPQKGAIKIGGMNIKDMSFDDFSDLISYVSQDNYLPNISLRDNILMGNPDASDDEFANAVEAAGCNEFIDKFEERYDTMAGDAGDRLSGGERQRISIARAIIKNAPIVILDEATASIDPENESKIQNALDRLSKGKTLIVIAHRLSTIVDADNIIVIDKGKILVQGTHNELLDNSECYRNMWNAHIGAKAWSMNSIKSDEKDILRGGVEW